MLVKNGDKGLPMVVPKLCLNNWLLEVKPFGFIRFISIKYSDNLSNLLYTKNYFIACIVLAIGMLENKTVTSKDTKIIIKSIKKT